MRALYFEEHGGLEQLRLGERPDPKVGEGEVLIRLQAAALNHLDLFVLRGLPGVPIPLPHIGGADGAGVVVEVGPGVQTPKVGDEVVFNPGIWCGACEFCRKGEHSLCVKYGIIGEHTDGTFAELVKVKAEACFPKPSHLSWEEAAAFPLTFLTAWRMLFTRAKLQAGETVLIHGIGGGVAQAATILARHAEAAVIVTSSDDAKLERAKELGAQITINYSREDVVRRVREITGKKGVDVVVETVGKATWMASLRSVAKGGRIVTCGATTGPDPSEEIRLIFWNQLSILGSTMGSQREFADMLAVVNQRKLKPLVDKVFPLTEGAEAYRYLAEGKQFGKVVVDVQA
ncbi:MAG: zinc-binding dehydrogenase [Thermoanaerobaculum sp.]|nr:zinc-binding dehydrogenase [Thermoanaerobaculum sp.]MDW7966739.1 zinc-binding dehydrogenase [Thermoanaerobaculum sp.]